MARPDLRIAGVGASAGSVTAGGALTVRATVRNAGVRRAGSSMTGFSLSRDARRSTDDLPLGPRVRTKALGPGKRVRRQRTVSTSGRTDAGIAQDMVLRQRQQTTVRLPGYTGANNDNAAVQTYLVNRNASGGTPSALALNNVAGGAPGFANTAGGAACPVP